jgi:hypothetical protein
MLVYQRQQLYTNTLSAKVTREGEGWPRDGKILAIPVKR